MCLLFLRLLSWGSRGAFSRLGPDTRRWLLRRCTSCLVPSNATTTHLFEKEWTNVRSSPPVQLCILTLCCLSFFVDYVCSNTHVVTEMLSFAGSWSTFCWDVTCTPSELQNWIQKRSEQKLLERAKQNTCTCISQLPFRHIILLAWAPNQKWHSLLRIIALPVKQFSQSILCARFRVHVSQGIFVFKVNWMRTHFRPSLLSNLQEQFKFSKQGIISCFACLQLSWLFWFRMFNSSNYM